MFENNLSIEKNITNNSANKRILYYANYVTKKCMQ